MRAGYPGVYLRVTVSTGTHGEKSYTGVWRPGDGARRQDTRLSSQTDGSKNGAAGIDAVERDPGQQHLQQVADTARTITHAGEKVLELAEPIDPDHPVESIVAGVVIGKVLKVGRSEAGETMRALGRKLHMTDADIDAVIASKKFSPLSPGPLSDDVAKNFRSSTYYEMTLTDDTTLYRVIGPDGEPDGRYWTRVEPHGALQSGIDSALDQNWGNPATQVVRATIPRGTTIYEGAAAAQRGLVGGGNQIFIPQVDPAWIQK